MFKKKKNWSFIINHQNPPNKEVIFLMEGKYGAAMPRVQLGHHVHLQTIPQL
jgi:hypothetical protein